MPLAAIIITDMSPTPLTNFSGPTTNYAKSFLSLELRPTYRSTESDTLREFYLPVLSRAKRYDRAVGFFSSSVFDLIREPILEFGISKGRMRLICSPALSTDDIASLAIGEEARVRYIDSSLLQTITKIEEQLPKGSLALAVMATLIAHEVLAVKICVPESGFGIYHEKLGIVHDINGNKIVFHGSCNETLSAWARNGESYDVFASWIAAEQRRVLDHESYFERLWDGKADRWTAYSLPELTLRRLSELARNSLEELSNEVAEERAISRSEKQPSPTSPMGLRPHQVAAIDAWERNQRRGILQHSTGSGKTLIAMTILQTHLLSNPTRTGLIVVPTTILLRQWQEELQGWKSRGSIDRLEVLLAGGGHDSWARNGFLRDHTRDDPDGGRVTLALLPTASSEEFLSNVRGGDHLMIIADEVHTCGSREYRNITKIRAGSRLGLSATPHRYGDTEGTCSILDYFGGVVHTYSLTDALNDGYLLPYWYDPRFVELDLQEKEQYENLTRLIAQHWGGAEEPSQKALELLIVCRQTKADRCVRNLRDGSVGFNSPV